MASPPTTAKFDKKLAHILAAAAQVFAEQGYDRASIRAVAERARVSVAGLYYYVRSKEELLFLIQFHAFDSLVARFCDDSEAVQDPAQRLELLVSNHLERFLANMAELVVCSREIDRLKGDFRTKIEDKRREYFNLGREIFVELAADGDTDVDPRTAALALFGSINWVHTWYHPDKSPPAADMARELSQLYLKGVLPSK